MQKIQRRANINRVGFGQPGAVLGHLYLSSLNIELTGFRQRRAYKKKNVHCPRRLRDTSNEIDTNRVNEINRLLGTDTKKMSSEFGGFLLSAFLFFFFAFNHLPVFRSDLTKRLIRPSPSWTGNVSCRTSTPTGTPGGRFAQFFGLKKKYSTRQ